MIGFSLAYRTLPAASVLVHAPRPPDTLELEQWVDAVIENRIERILVFSTAAGPTVTQRKSMLAKVFEAQLKPRTAIVTDSPAVRGIVTAISWFQAYDLRAFAEAEVHAAIQFIGAVAMRSEILAAANELRIALGAKAQHGG